MILILMKLLNWYFNIKSYFFFIFDNRANMRYGNLKSIIRNLLVSIYIQVNFIFEG